LEKLLPKFIDCFCCGNENTKGLNINYYFKGNKVYADFIADKEYLISENILHPGIAMGVLFEAMSWLVSYTLGHSMVLVDFNVRVLKPATTCTKLSVIAEAISINRWVSEVCGTLKNEDGNICFKAIGKFTYRTTNDEHINNFLHTYDREPL